VALLAFGGVCSLCELVFVSIVYSRCPLKNRTGDQRVGVNGSR
jgi:hypothetical protein